MNDSANDPELVITFDSPADVWRVRRGELSIEISIEEMTSEYYRWQREGSPGGDWREHAKELCRRRLERHATL